MKKKNKDKNKNKREKKLSNHIWEMNILLSIKTINMYKYQSNITDCTGTYMFINKLYTKFNVNGSHNNFLQISWIISWN